MALGMLATGLMYASFPVLPNMIWLVILYTLSAVGSVMADLAKTAMVGDIAGEEERGRIFGVYQLTAGIGASVGPLVGGWVYDHLGNHLPFYMNGALLILSALWAARYLGSDAEAGSPSRESKQRI
jgi:MFS family permease